MRRILSALLLTGISTGVTAAPVGGTFSSIDGGEVSLEGWRGQPVLVVNTASRCGFTHQYDGLQALYDKYRDRGLVVFAVPSNDFRQELATDAQVREFCEVRFDLDLPMSTISSVRGTDAHPFYRAVKSETGFVPSWNFNKILLGPGGEVVATWGSMTSPESAAVTQEIEALLN
ncbi:MAG: glutathione peroxidase [Pseudomonadota bacterium]